MMNMRCLTLPTVWFADLKSRIDWARVGKWFSVVLLLAAGYMIVTRARDVDWQAVWSVIQSYSWLELLAAGMLTACGFAVYSTFDLFGRHYTGHDLQRPRVMLITAISYAFNLTLGSIVGAAGIRLRLYQQLGVKGADVARIIAISVGINWLGYALVAGVLFAANLVSLPDAWHVNPATLPTIGWALLSIVAAYIGTTAFKGDTQFSLRGKDLCVPRLAAALVQLALGCANWLIMGGVLYCLMRTEASYPLTLSVVMVASVAGIISRIPGGIGILEATSIAILAPQLGETKVLAGILAYRAVYYLSPLALATLGLLALEAANRKRHGKKGYGKKRA
ncbi:MAG TPA: lysylphosphatidylglycerol synthase domain-containing protein [Rhodocyclaceae bacterium]|nr:lysylphosphatidylglycerol synthase domain-containing protein [Rhodocyclaceae bacterium]